MTLWKESPEVRCLSGSQDKKKLVQLEARPSRSQYTWKLVQVKASPSGSQSKGKPVQVEAGYGSVLV